MLHRILYRVIRVADYPDSEVAAFIPLQSSNEFAFRQLYPAIGGSYGNDFTNVVSISLKCRGSSIVCMFGGIKFHNRGPITANKLSCGRADCLIYSEWE